MKSSNHYSIDIEDTDMMTSTATEQVKGWSFRVKKVPGVNEFRTMFYYNGRYRTGCDYFASDLADATSMGKIECALLNKYTNRISK